VLEFDSISFSVLTVDLHSAPSSALTGDGAFICLSFCNWQQDKLIIVHDKIDCQYDF
jgi:hypothetical protein